MSGTIAAGTALIQQPSADAERIRGSELYRQGDANGAVEALRGAVKTNRDDAEAWHYLGLALLLKGSKDEARAAFEKAATIRLKDMAAASPISNTQDANARRLQAAERYQAVIDSFEQYLQITPNPTEVWISDLQALRFYRDYYSGLRSDETIVTTKEATVKLHILSKPAPVFSGLRATGTAVLRALFGSDGTVKYVIVLHRVESHFDQACIEAAKRIKFEPAFKDGRPVSMILQLEYSRYQY